MAAVSGAAGLKPALAAVDRGATVALANKECLVCAGDFFMQRAAKAGACILPADSEHNALFQALSSGNREELVRVIITASGGPFRTWAATDIEQATLAQALKHPNWSMGQKITINSASMMNKGLEVIEAVLSVRADARRDRRSRASAVDHPRHGRILRSLGGRPARRTRHAHPDRALPRMARPNRRSVGQAGSRQDRTADLRGAGFRAVPGACGWLTKRYVPAVARLRYTMPPTRWRWRPSSPAQIKFGAIARLVEATMNDWIRAGNLAPLSSADDAIAVDHNARNRAASLLPQIALKAS